MGNESFFRDGAPQRAHSRSSASLFEALQECDLERPQAKPARKPSGKFRPLNTPLVATTTAAVSHMDMAPIEVMADDALMAAGEVESYSSMSMQPQAAPSMVRAEVLDSPLLLTQRVDPQPHFDAYEELVKQARSGRKAAWIVASAMIVVCAAQAAAIAVMLPLKEVQPYTVLVDKQSGYVEVARGLQLGDLSEDQAVVHSMVAQYVLARETFDPADFKDRYERVALWSLDGARQSFVSQYQPGSNNVLNGMQPGQKVAVSVKNVELLEPGKARVRYDLASSLDGAPGTRVDRQAIVSYRFVGTPMRMEDRLLNPLGFQVTDFRSDLETPPDAQFVSTPTAPSPAPMLKASAPLESVSPQGLRSAAPPPGKVASVLSPPASSPASSNETVPQQ